MTEEENISKLIRFEKRLQTVLAAPRKGSRTSRPRRPASLNSSLKAPRKVGGMEVSEEMSEKNEHSSRNVPGKSSESRPRRDGGKEP
jgi:hypothetical protein